MKLTIGLLCAIAAAALLQGANAQVTYVGEIPINSPVAWYPVVADMIVGYYRHIVDRLIQEYRVVKWRLERQNALLCQFPPFYGSVGVFYDGDHLRSILSKSKSFDAGRNLNFTVPQPKVAVEVVDTVKAMMDNLKFVKN